MMMEAILKNEERAVFDLRALYRRYGYAPYKMSRFEEYDLYVRNKDFLVSDQIITFSGPRGKLMALKPDVTLSIVKNAPEEPGVVQKVYYNENVYRDCREIMQAGLECAGDLGSYEIAEVALLAVKSLEALGGKYVLDLSHMGLISAVLDVCGLEDSGKAMECLRRKNLHELETLCADNEIAWQKLSALLPTTPLLLLAAALWLRSSERLHSWLINHRVFGEYIQNFRIHRAIPLRVKIYATTLVWLTIGYCIFAVVNEHWWAQLLMALLATAITWHILSYKTLK